MRVLSILTALALPILILLGVKEEDPKDCRVEVKEVVRSVYGTGYVRNARYVEIRATVSGRVLRLFVTEGDEVKKGDLIAVLDSGGLEERVREAEERIRLLEAKLKENSDFRRFLDLKVAMAEEEVSKARLKYERRKRLYEKGVIPRETLEDAERVYKLALTKLEVALRERDIRIRELEHELRSLKEVRASLEKDLARYRIRSPIDGVVLKVFVEEGDTVNPVGGRDLIASVGSKDREVVLFVDEELAPLVRRGQKVYLRLDALPGRVFEGEVLSRDLESDPSRRVVRVVVGGGFPSSVPANSVAEGNIIVDILKTTVVPKDAVKDGHVTLMVSGRRIKVKVERVFKDYAEVIGYPEGTPCEIP